MTDNYIPVSCDLYDKLTEAAVLKNEVLLDYKADAEIKQIKTAVINIVTKDKEEFLITSDEESIRLDKI
ncbi:MAG: hypothetical protein H7Y00_03180, partial [Fimbriimonadaceae bacterium]|nr:hypothetical protein [Chitinophagales bacterium]